MSNVSDALDRIVASQKEIISGCDAYPVYFWQQETFPYWTNRLGAITHEIDSQLEHIFNYTVTMRLVIGHLSEGYKGEREDELYTTYIPDTLAYFSQRIQLQNASYPTQMVDLDPRGVFVRLGTGLAIFDNTGIGVQQVGAEFTLDLPIKVQLFQVY